jgi:hypothetical protein
VIVVGVGVGVGVGELAQDGFAAAAKASEEVDRYLNHSLAVLGPRVTSVGIDDAVKGPVTDGPPL